MTGQQLRRVRKAMGLTQLGLAERLKMTSTSIARMERGEQTILLVTELAVRYLRVMEKQRKGGKANGRRR